MKTWRQIKFEKFSQGRNKEIGSSIGVKEVFFVIVVVVVVKAK